MTTETPTSSTTDLLAALAELDGVTGATTDEWSGRPGQVRLAVADGADEQRVLAEAEALLGGRVGGGSRRAGVVEEVGRVTGDGRLALEHLRLVTSDDGIAASMTLSLDDRSATGSAQTARPGDDGMGEAVVGAALLALEELTEDAVIGTVERAAVDADGVARIRLRLDVDGAEVAAEGEASVLAHRPQAVIRAVLAALEPHLPD